MERERETAGDEGLKDELDEEEIRDPGAGCPLPVPACLESWSGAILCYLPCPASQLECDVTSVRG